MSPHDPWNHEDPDSLEPKEIPPDSISRTPDDSISAGRYGEIPSGTYGPGLVVPGMLVAPPTPHPSFGWSLLWCFLFLMVTQIIPAIGIVIVLIGLEIGEGGLDHLQRPDGVDRLQKRSMLPALLASQLLGIAISCLALRLVAGRDWMDQIALRLPRLWQVIVAVVAFPGMSILAGGAYALAKEFLPGFNNIPCFFLSQAITIFLAWLIIRLTFGQDWGQNLGRQPPLLQLGLVLVGFSAVVLATVGVYRMASPHMPVFRLEGNLMEQMVEVFRSWPWPLAVLLVGLGPGLSEELWCRGFLGRGLVGCYGVVLGAVLASYLFGLIHVEPHQASMAVLMGFVLHYAYLTTRSIVIPMLLHALNNSLSVVGDRLGDEISKVDVEPEKIHWLIYTTAGLLVLAAGWAFYQGRARLFSAADGLAEWQPPFPGVAWPPPYASTVVVRPWPGWLPSAAVGISAVLFGVAVYLVVTGRLVG